MQQYKNPPQQKIMQISSNTQKNKPLDSLQQLKDANQDQYTTIGPIKFSMNKLQQQPNINKKHIDKLLKKIQTIVHNVVFQMLQKLPYEILPALQQYQGVKLFLKYTKWTLSPMNNLSSISHINLSSLKTLNLQNSQLTNIQVLSFIKAPIIKQLNLDNNYILNINPLNKTDFPQLQILQIKANYINQTQALHKLNFSQLGCFFIDSMKSFQSKTRIIEDVRFLLKLKNQRSKKYALWSPNRDHVLIKNYLKKLNRKGNSIDLSNYKYKFQY